MKTTLLIAALFAATLAGCTRHTELPLIKIANLPAPATDIAVRHETLGDANLMLFQAIDWRTWKLSFPEIKPTDNFWVQLLLITKAKDEAQVLSSFQYMPFTEGKTLRNAPYVLVSLFPEPLTDSVMKASKLKIKTVYYPGDWNISEKQMGSWGGTAVDRTIPNYHLKDGSNPDNGASGIGPQNHFSSQDTGRYVLDQGWDTQLVLLISRIR